jgi:hypothetical protein
MATLIYLIVIPACFINISNVNLNSALSKGLHLCFKPNWAQIYPNCEKFKLWDTVRKTFVLLKLLLTDTEIVCQVEVPRLSFGLLHNFYLKVTYLNQIKPWAALI